MRTQKKRLNEHPKHMFELMGKYSQSYAKKISLSKPMKHDFFSC